MIHVMGLRRPPISARTAGVPVALAAVSLLLVASATLAAASAGAGAVSATPPGAAPDATAAAYRSVGGIHSRVVIWVVAELHLMFGAFVLGVPIVASIVEVVG